MMRLASIVILAGSAAIMAAPVPSDSVENRIQRYFGERSDPDNLAGYGMNSENELSMTLRAGRAFIGEKSTTDNLECLYAPRTRFSIKGDFDVTVRVRISGLPELTKGTDSSYFAGIYIESDEKHSAITSIVRIDQGVEFCGCFGIAIEDGITSGGFVKTCEHFPTTATFTLKMTRRGDLIGGSVKQKDGEFEYHCGNDEKDKSLSVKLDDAVKVGVYAAGNNKGFTATFDSFKITPVKEAKP